jgi:plastocyanin
VTLLAALAAVLVGLPAGGALARQGAPGVQVQTLNYVFIPDPVRITPGQTVRWVNPIDRANHTSTNYAPLALWDSGEIVKDGSFSFAFTAAGSYDYLCTIHERFDMVSSVMVLDKVSPPSGPVGTIFSVLVASVPAPTDYVYDIQKKNPGGTWQGWMVGVTAATAQFDSTGFPMGTYKFRSRLHRISDDAASGYSPAVDISVT